MFKRLTTVLLIMALIVTPFLSSASLQSDIDEMFRKFGFKSNTTAPGAYMGQTMGYLTPGALNIRATTNTIKPFTITPPRFKAGCGGIDMFFGGISFINKDEFIALAKQIGQNAVGYAFHLALNAICPSCEAQLQNLQNFIQKLNKLQTDTCTAAEALVNGWGGPSPLLQAALESCKKYRMSEPYNEDADTAHKKCVDSVQRGPTLDELYNDFAQTLTGGQNTKATVPPLLPGNSGVQALARFGDLDTEQKQLAINVTGFYTRCKDSGGSVSQENWNPPKLEFKDFWFGFEDKEVYEWNNNPQSCDVNTTTMSHPGFRQKVIDTVTRIAEARLNGSQLSADDKAFIDASTVPILPLLDEASSNRAVVNATVELLADVIAVDMAYALMNKYITDVLSGTGNQHVVKPDQFRDSIEKVREKLAWEVANAANIFQVRVNAVTITKLFIDQLKKSNFNQIASKIK